MSKHIKTDIEWNSIAQFAYKANHSSAKYRLEEAFIQNSTNLIPARLAPRV